MVAALLSALRAKGARVPGRVAEWCREVSSPWPLAVLPVCLCESMCRLCISPHLEGCADTECSLRGNHAERPALRDIRREAADVLIRGIRRERSARGREPDRALDMPQCWGGGWPSAFRRVRQ